VFYLSITSQTTWSILFKYSSKWCAALEKTDPLFVVLEVWNLKTYFNR
jgi:hypothetical protein